MDSLGSVHIFTIDGSSHLVRACVLPAARVFVVPLTSVATGNGAGQEVGGVETRHTSVVEMTTSTSHAKTGSRKAEPVRAQPRPRPGDAAAIDQIRRRLSEEVGEDRIRRFFAEGTTLSLAEDRLDVTVPSKFLADYLDRRFGAALRRAAEVPDAEGHLRPVRLHFLVDESAAAPSPVPEATPAAGRDAQALARSATGSATVRRRPKATPMRYRHRLDEFIVGPTNRLAHGAALRLAEAGEREKASPLFIHGHCGLGKTHLLQGLANRFQELRPHAVVRCLTSEEFTNEYVNAVRNNRLDEFRRTYRGVDLLCLDDAHFLSSKEKTQTELLHTFDAIDLGGARIVLASDDHPREIKKLCEQLVSRFLAGAVVRLDPPDTDTRLKIVRHLAGRRTLPMEEAALQLIADRGGRCGPGGTPGSVRDIEGMLTQVEAMYRLVPETAIAGTIGAVLVRKALNLGDADPRLESVRPRRPIQVDRINAEICRTLGVTVQEMMGIGRHPKVVLARSVIAYLARKLTTLSFPEIAKQMGRPNHSTIITAHKRISAVIDANAATDSIQWAGVDLGPEFAGLTAREFVDRLDREIVRGAD